MGRVDPRALVWALNRGHLRFGAVFWLVVAAMLAVLSMLIVLAGNGWRLRQLDAQLAERIVELREIRETRGEMVQEEELSLPSATARFELTRQILARLKEAGFQPDEIRFRFEELNDAGLLRQTAIFKMKARWEQIADALDSLQQADRALYIAKLRLERDAPSDPLVTAEVQIAIALTYAGTEDEP